jgi:multidrug resistance efflux pump
MIAFLCIVYTAVVVVLFKLKVLRPRPYPIAWVAVAGVLLIGGVVVVWALSAPMSKRVVTTQYVVQLVPYVKGQVLKVHAQANQPVKKGDLLLEINPEPYQYTVNQLEAQLAAARDNVKQSQAALAAADANVVKAGAGINQAQAAVTQSRAALTNAQAALTKARAALANAQAGVAKAKASDDLAKTEEQIALNLQKMDAGAISILNNVRLQDFKTQELVGVYQQKVLTAAQEVENGIISFLNSQREARSLAASVKDAALALKLASDNFTAGTIDYTPVFVAEQFLVQQQIVCAQAQGDIALGLIQVYRALGGGWELRLADSAAHAEAVPVACPSPTEVIPPARLLPPEF